MRNEKRLVVPYKAVFTTTLFRAGKTATGFEVPAAVVEALKAGKRPPVRVTINGYSYRNTVAVMGGVFMIGVSAEHRKGAGVEGGDKIEVTLELDTEERVAELPADLQKALAKDPVAKKNFEGLSYSGKQGYLLPIKDAKTPETRQRRIDKVIFDLSK